jgi:hypothetical protein
LSKKLYTGNSLKIGPNFFLQHFKNKIIFNYVKFMATKKGMTTNFYHPSLLLLFLDPGSEIRDLGSGIRDPGSEIRDPRSKIRDPGSEIRDPGWVKIRIRDKHRGSATLSAAQHLSYFRIWKGKELIL